MASIAAFAIAAPSRAANATARMDEIVQKHVTAEQTVDPEVQFVRDADGRFTHLMMKRDGRVRKAPRVGD